jgi:transposase
MDCVSKPRAITISKADRDTLKGWVRSRSVDNATAGEIAAALRISARNVYEWVGRFDEEGIEGLQERPRSGRPRALALDGALEILRKTIEETPPGATHWSVRLMAAAVGVTKHRKPSRTT